MAKPKYNYKGKEFLDNVEKLAKKGLTDREIAISLDIAPQYFSEKKNAITELSEVLSRARAQIVSTVRARYLQLALGGMVVKRTSKDGDGNIAGWVEDELPPNLNALGTWLYHHDPEWKECTDESKRLDVTSNGKDLNRLSDEQLSYVINELLNSIDHENKH